MNVSVVRGNSTHKSVLESELGKIEIFMHFENNYPFTYETDITIQPQ